MKANFCLNCGSPLHTKLQDGRDRAVCTICGWIHYEQRKVSAGVRVEKDRGLLLVQRGIEPWYQHWCMPAGFVEVDEDPADAAVREAYEETGLKVQIKGLAGTYTYCDDPRGNGIVLLYDAVIIGGVLQKTNETLQAGFFTCEEIDQMKFAGASTDRQVRDWVKLAKNSNEANS